MDIEEENEYVIVDTYLKSFDSDIYGSRGVFMMTCRFYVGIYVELRWQTDAVPCSPSGHASYDIIYFNCF